MTNDKWVDDKYPVPGKEVLLDSLFDGQVVGYYDDISDEFRNKSHEVVLEVRGWQELPESMVEFVSLKQKILMKGSNLSVKGQKR